MAAPPMSFLDQVKDKASSLLPSSFTQEVEKTTSGVRAAPDYEGAMLLSDAANSEEYASDVVRAVRRRMAVKNGKVQYFAVVLLDILVKNGYGVLHVEVAENKGLIHELLQIALTPYPTDAYREAKNAALTFILSASKWFAAYPNPKCKIFTDLPDAVRRFSADPQVFDDIVMDTTVRLHVEHLPPTRRAPQLRRAEGGREVGRPRAHPNSPSAPPAPSSRVVQAIPIEIPSDEAASGMLDACMVLSECLADVEAAGGTLTGNELTSSLVAQIRQNHHYVGMLVGCGLPLPNAEVLTTVLDGQHSVLRQFDHAIRRETAAMAGETSGGEGGGGSSDSPASPSSPPRDPNAGVHRPPTTDAPHPTPAIIEATPQRRKGRPTEVGDVEMTLVGVTAPRQAADVDGPTETTPGGRKNPQNALDDLFGETPTTPNPPPPPPSPATEGAPPRGSLPADGDDFDAFLNRRLAGES